MGERFTRRVWSGWHVPQVSCAERRSPGSLIRPACALSRSSVFGFPLWHRTHGNAWDASMWDCSSWQVTHRPGSLQGTVVSCCGGVPHQRGKGGGAVWGSFSSREGTRGAGCRVAESPAQTEANPHDNPHRASAETIAPNLKEHTRSKGLTARHRTSWHMIRSCISASLSEVRLPFPQ
jgi:hypothetical protein